MFLGEGERKLRIRRKIEEKGDLQDDLGSFQGENRAKREIITDFGVVFLQFSFRSKA